MTDDTRRGFLKRTGTAALSLSAIGLATSTVQADDDLEFGYYYRSQVYADVGDTVTLPRGARPLAHQDGQVVVLMPENYNSFVDYTLREGSEGGWWGTSVTNCAYGVDAYRDSNDDTHFKYLQAPDWGYSGGVGFGSSLTSDGETFTMPHNAVVLTATPDEVWYMSFDDASGPWHDYVRESQTVSSGNDSIYVNDLLDGIAYQSYYYDDKIVYAERA